VSERLFKPTSMKRKIFTIYAMIICVTIIACNKLDEKPKQSLVVPETIDDFQRMMDNSTIFNISYNVTGEVSSDNFYVTEATFNGLSALIDKNAYTWSSKLWENVPISLEWESNYQRILYCNLVLEGLDKKGITVVDQTAYNNVKGRALFQRALSLFMVTTAFCKAYDPATATTDVGIPLRLSSDLNVPSKRSTLQEAYEQIFKDILLARELLPVNDIYKTRPTKAAADALLARIYLEREDYGNAFLYSDNCLRQYSTLINYNSLSTSAGYPLVQMNTETIFYGTISNNGILLPSRAVINPDLYQLYAANDLRKVLFFASNGNGTYSFKGNYNGQANPQFGGIATDEMFLVRAECHARLGRTNDAIDDLNTLMITRFRTGTFIPFTASTPDEALSKILIERRKELVLRGLRWNDLRRLNKDPRFAITLSRTLGSQTFTLPPNDARYTFKVPDYVIALAPTIDQNP